MTHPAACAECGGSGTWPHRRDEPARPFHNRGCSQAPTAYPATAAHRLAVDLLWVAYTAVTLVGVLIAVTAQSWDTILAACVLCFVRGRGRR